MILRPLIPAAPLVGGVSVFFLNRPVSFLFERYIHCLDIRNVFNAYIYSIGLKNELLKYSVFFSVLIHQDIDFDLTNLANILDIPGLR